MTTNIRMYDCAFGDCFRISCDDGFAEQGKHLYVDFGISNRCLKIKEKQTRYDYIINDMPEKADFLLTHYHCDHYSGLCYMIKHSTKKFNNVYIPDVWDIDGSIEVVKLILLNHILKRTVLNRGMSIISFLISICHSTGRIHFVRRGTHIQDRYVALWPTEGKIQQAADKLIKNINQVCDLPKDLNYIAEELCGIMKEMSTTEHLEQRNGLIKKLEKLELHFVSVAANIKVDKSLQKRLSDFEHSINIIFHSKDGKTGDKILFTGDSRNNKKLWEFIENNSDGLVPFHSKYDVIKIPHHGTKRYYHNFRNRVDNRSIYLIPNSSVKDWLITQQYSEDANIQGCTVYCTNHDSCEAANGKCSCIKANCIYPQHFVDVSTK